MRPGLWPGYVKPVVVLFPWFFAFLGVYGALQGVVLAVPGNAVAVVVAVVAAAAFVAGYAAVARAVEHRTAEEVGSPVASGLLAGAALGAGLFTAAIGLLAATGLYDLRAGDGLAAAAPALAVAVLSGVCEEVLFRGVLVRRLEGPFGTWVALAASSLLFGAAHLANRNASLAGAVAIALEAGLLLGLCYVLTRRLWLGIGVHAAWNFTQGGVFGVAVSGNDVGGSWLRSVPAAGRDALTGGGFGVEASPAAVLVCVLASAVLLVAVRRRGTVVPPAWRPADATEEPVVTP